MDDPLIGDYDDMIRYLVASDFSVMNQYSGFFQVFHNEFLRTYSDHCSGLIEDPVEVEFTPTAIDFDMNDQPIDRPRQIGPTRISTFERRYYDKLVEFEPQNANDASHGGTRRVHRTT